MVELQFMWLCAVRRELDQIVEPGLRLFPRRASRPLAGLATVSATQSQPRTLARTTRLALEFPRGVNA